MTNFSKEVELKIYQEAAYLSATKCLLNPELVTKNLIEFGKRCIEIYKDSLIEETNDTGEDHH